MTQSSGNPPAVGSIAKWLEQFIAARHSILADLELLKSTTFSQYQAPTGRIDDLRKRADNLLIAGLFIVATEGAQQAATALKNARQLLSDLQFEMWKRACQLEFSDIYQRLGSRSLRLRDRTSMMRQAESVRRELTKAIAGKDVAALKMHLNELRDFRTIVVENVRYSRIWFALGIIAFIGMLFLALVQSEFMRPVLRALGWG